ncbi:MAG TPA: L-threonylcarbamoyladenylate synthase, partial [Pirellulaceae bacterium]|nr:L-threonylcarbamoyladenylate synthase [Pirellulaceae bacterium]
GIRIPRHPVAQALLREFGRGVAAPSANRFGRVSPTTAEHVREELGDVVSVILDGGPCEVGLESTIVDVSGSAPTVLRPGAVTAEQISAALGKPVGHPTSDAPRVPGALASHYAPRARVELVRPENLESRLDELLCSASRIAVLTDRSLASHPQIVRIDLSAEPESQARHLYAALRMADHFGCDVALVPIPDEAGLGVAIADRLRRAAGQGGAGEPTQN